ncbi:MAG TPA: M1 family aminopeptidase [Thermoanaerobaculia bacterium]
MTRSLVLSLTLALSLTAVAADNSEYVALRAARPDGRTVAVSDLVLDRDAFRIHLRSGTVHFLEPVAGRTTGLVFTGDGSYELRPATESERRHLELLTGEKGLEMLSDRFDSIVLLFGDGTADEILKHAEAVVGAPDDRAKRIYEDYLKEQRNRYHLNLHLRVLRDLLDAPTGGVFVAAVNGKAHPPALLVHEPFGIGSLAAKYGFFGGEETAMIVFDQQKGGIWYLSGAKQTAKNGHGKPLRPLADAQHYSIETTIQRSEITGRATIRLIALADGLRVLPLHIMPKLRISGASYRVDGAEETKTAGIVQEDTELGRIARLFRYEGSDADAAVIFDESLKKGTKVELTLDYAGNEVLTNIGADTWSVDARDSWYPNLGTFTDLATYELTFRYPKRNHLISVGERVSETEEDSRKVAVWRADHPIRVAGFNYGRFEKKSQQDKESGMTVDVYSNRDFAKKSGDMMADAINSARVSTMFFGPVPYSPISVTQQVEWNFGQSWPSLVYLPTLAFTTSTERALEGFGPSAGDINEFVKTVGWHEMAHQWWGHHVGWESYRDQWLSEGLAEFTAALVLQFTESTKAYDDYWERKRRDILDKSRGGQVRNSEAGPISQGFRLSTHRAPSAAQTIMYGKGAYVVHMLRMMMRGGANPDERFITMMRDFAQSQAGRNPSTADFQKVVERHMTPQMNLTGDGRMSWFIDQWIHGIEIPRIRSEIGITDLGGGKYKLSGWVSQEGVSDNFRSPIPIYADFGQNKSARIGVMPVVGNNRSPIEVEMALPSKPRRIVVNLMHDILAMD